MLDSLKKFFSSRSLSGFFETVKTINALEPEIQKLSNEELKQAGLDLKKSVEGGEPTEDERAKAFALVREAARRTLNQRPYDVQLVGGLVLDKGAVAEMATGEGKTLAAVAPAYWNALRGKGAHIVTVNEYLARRDAVWMGQIYRRLGLSVACLVPNAAFLYDSEWKIPEEGEKLIDRERDETGSFLVQQEFLRPISRREAYLADITYGTNHEFGFDYLRDNLAYHMADQVQREHYFAIIDEVDSILIDEARTPLIIAAPDTESSEYYKVFARVAEMLTPEEDYTVDEKHRSASITESGIEKTEKSLGLANLYGPENLRLVHYLEESLRAKALYHRDRDYVVKGGEVLIVDEFTGRLLHGRRYQGGLHQAIEAKESVQVKQESRTYGKISLQNYFRLYKKISGMTGTAQTSAEEFHKVYNLEVFSIPTNKPMIREDKNDLIYKNSQAKWRALIEDIRVRHKQSQPILIGTASIEKNELVSAHLSREHIPHEVLNAKNNEREGAIIAQAGKPGAVTVATNMAGRGVDIILGGNPPSADLAQTVRGLGGLHVVGTERHEARRIDNQLRGRSGRQGDQGSSQFYLSLEDDLLRIFGGDRIKSLMDRFDLPEDEPIQLGFVSSAVAQAQARVEGANFDLRKHLLEYDDVLNKQRTAVYKRRQEFLTSLNQETLADSIYQAAHDFVGRFREQPAMEPETDLDAEFKKLLQETGIANEKHPVPENLDEESIKSLLLKRSLEASLDPLTIQRILGVLDMLWMTHLENLEALSESVGLRAYGQKDPLVEYREEARKLFKDFWANFNAWLTMNIFKLAKSKEQMANSKKAGLPAGGQSGAKVGRNDPCPCGSGKKYKRCHGA